MQYFAYYNLIQSWDFSRQLGSRFQSKYLGTSQNTIRSINDVCNHGVSIYVPYNLRVVGAFKSNGQGIVIVVYRLVINGEGETWGGGDGEVYIL